MRRTRPISGTLASGWLRIAAVAVLVSGCQSEPQPRAVDVKRDPRIKRETTTSVAPVPVAK